MAPKIFLDFRERKIEPLLRSLFEDVEVKTLPVGDIFMVFDTHGVLVERKSACDFLNSIKSNRLWEQLRRMHVDRLDNVPVARRILLIHGQIEDVIEEAGMRWSHVMGAYQDIQFNYRIPIFHAPDEHAMGEFFRILVKREMENKNAGEIKELWSRAIPKKAMSDEEWKIYVLSSFPFVGEKIARALLSHFGSIERIATASVEELKNVEGIGEKKARRIHELFH